MMEVDLTNTFDINKNEKAFNFYFKDNETRDIITRIIKKLYGTRNYAALVALGFYFTADNPMGYDEKLKTIDAEILNAIHNLSATNKENNPVMQKPDNMVHPVFADKDDTQYFNDNGVIFIGRMACSDEELTLDDLDDYSNLVGHSDYFINTHQDIFREWLKKDTGIKYDGNERINVEHLITISDTKDIVFYRQYTFFDTESQLETNLLIRLNAKELPACKYHVLADFQK